MAGSAALQEQLKLQDEAAQSLLAERRRQGALDFDRVETEAMISDGRVQGITITKKNRASELIENFMLAANGVMAKTLTDAGVCSIRRVVKTPERWPRIVELAAQHGETLPGRTGFRGAECVVGKDKGGGSGALRGCVARGCEADGSGGICFVAAEAREQGHFALAAHDYTHSTAPNRRFADTVTQRLIKAVLGKMAAPYSAGATGFDC